MNCRVCGNAAGNTAHRLREMMFGYRDEFDYMECAACKCVQIVDIPSSISKYYPSTYHSFAPVGPRRRFRRLPAKLRDRYALSRRGMIGKLLSRRSPPDPALESLARINPTDGMRILDVGCGSGLLLNALADLGFRNLLGVDPFLPGDVQRDNGVKLLKTSLSGITGEFDVIMFHHSFEHLADPHESLNAAQRLLSPGGHCVIRMPTVTCYAWRYYGTNWVQLDAPRHFCIHSVESVRILADRSGLELSEIKYDSTAFQFWASEQYGRDISLYDPRSYAVAPGRSIFTKKQIEVFQRRAAELNGADMGDQAVFYLTKRSVA